MFYPKWKELPITPAFCFAHAQWSFFGLADIEENAREGQKGNPISAIALEAVRRPDELLEIECAINGRSADERRAVCQGKSKPSLSDMDPWLLHEREALSRSAEVLKPINYMLKRWADFARFLYDGRICLTNNCAERALGRHKWTFAGSQRGADRAPGHADDDHDLPPQRRRSQSPARRHPRPYRSSSRLASARTSARDWTRLRQAEKPAMRTPMLQSGDLRRMRAIMTFMRYQFGRNTNVVAAYLVFSLRARRRAG
ncbi:hypothetical protein GCM10007874_50000 [Labrys miyagiensis]|uniref:Transposase IS66 central domain-containing protein n=1 Tax=Labrys miyagiensis TaxID=346912 RepID=A0ABQ6CQC3_9HYPH|nr:hypothetical protein GCM10007874_50000 [Labrys miyagiensis]